MSGPAGFTCLVNPHSGAGASMPYVVEVARVLRGAGARVEVSYTQSPAAVPELARAAVARGDAVVAVGGDGMVASVVGVVVELGGVLGLAPAGRGNDFARMLGVPDAPAAAAARLLAGQARDVDVLDVLTPGGPAVVAGSVYAGIDARAAAMVARMRRTPRPLQYPFAAFASIVRYVPHRFRLSVDGVAREYEAANVVVANSAYYGAGMRIAPAAELDDGELDVIVVEAGSRIDFLRTFPKVYDGRHVDHPKVSVLRGRAVELAVLSAHQVEVGADGEDLGLLPRGGAEPMRISVRPGALRVL